MIASIHQPNFFPWMGYFAKMERSDAFVFLDDVEFSAGSYINRVRLLFGESPGWATCPVERKAGSKKIKDVMLGNDPRWKRKLLSGIQQSYSKAPFLGDCLPLVEEMVSGEWDSLAAMNIAAIRRIADLLDIKTGFYRQSDLGLAHKDLAGSRLLAEICVQIGASEYLAGGGAEGYEELDAYEQNNLGFSQFRFTLPHYAQSKVKQFVPGLSIIDALFNIGPCKTRELISSEAK